MTKPYDKKDGNDNRLRVVLAGGGSGGPVVPLFVIAKEMQALIPAEFLLIGTSQGPERKMADWNNIPFKSIFAGKLRRYFSFKTFIAPFQSLLGFFQARRLLKRFKADVLIAAGGFVSVPAGYAAWSLGIPVLIHQQDITPSISNKLLAPIASAITVTFQKSLKDFSGQRALGLTVQDGEEAFKVERCVWTGNPVRPEIAELSQRVKTDEPYHQELRAKFKMSADWPVLLIVGGGTGAADLNRIILEALPLFLQRFEVIHGTGVGKAFAYEHQRYHQFELIANMPEALALADIVICRAGIGTITELSAAKKPAIIVPMPDSHQEENALYFHDRSAALIYAQELLDGPRLASVVSNLLYDNYQKESLSEHVAEIMPKDAAKRIANKIIELCQLKK